MTKRNIDAVGLFAALHTASDDVLQLLSSAGEEAINTVPFEGSWTAGQVAEHIRKSVNSLRPYLQKAGKDTGRKPDERVNEFKDMFLSADNKFTSPGSILPGNEPFRKASLLAGLESSFGDIHKEGGNVNLSELVFLPAFGDTTKLELLYFILYHTQRHLRQMKKVIGIVQQDVA